MFDPAEAEAAVAESSDRRLPQTAGLLQQRLVALFAAFVLLVNFPLLSLWDHPVRVFGLPLFPLALFLLWAAGIAALAWLLERRPH